jgi:hypothetical protein
MAWPKTQQPAAGRVRLLLEAADRRQQKLIMNIINLGEVSTFWQKPEISLTANESSKTSAHASPPCQLVMNW